MAQGITMQAKKPCFRDAMSMARAAVTHNYEPPLTRAEVFAAYRSARDAGCVFLRNTFKENAE